MRKATSFLLVKESQFHSRAVFHNRTAVRFSYMSSEIWHSFKISEKFQVVFLINKYMGFKKAKSINSPVNAPVWYFPEPAFSGIFFYNRLSIFILTTFLHSWHHLCTSQFRSYADKFCGKLPAKKILF
jgi:hypothetical protein